MNETLQEARRSEAEEYPQSPTELWAGQREEEKARGQGEEAEYVAPTNRRSGGRGKESRNVAKLQGKPGVKPNYQIEINRDPQDSPQLQKHNKTAVDPMMLFVQKSPPVSEHRKKSLEQLSWEQQEVNSENALQPAKKQGRHRGSDVLNVNDVYWNQGVLSNQGSDQFKQFQNISQEDFTGGKEEQGSLSNVQSDNKSVNSKSSNTKKELLSSKGIGRELAEENIKINKEVVPGQLPIVRIQSPNRTSPTGKRNSVNLSIPRDRFLNSPAMSSRSAMDPEGAGLLKVMPSRLSGFSKQRSSDDVQQNNYMK